MRTRRLLACGVASAAAAGLALTASAGAQPGATAARHHISIHAQPNPDVTGDPVVIFGRLTGPNSGDRTVVLWHRVAGQSTFTPIQRTTTDGNGFYDIQRADGVVRTNRNWFVRALGVRSRVVHEKVHAEVTLSAPSSGTTSQPIPFTGNVTPNHRGERILIQRQVGSTGDEWKTIGSGRIGPGGTFDASLRLRVPDEYTIRALFRGDRFNLGAPSSAVEVLVSQAQNPNLQLSASPDPTTVGDPVTLSGVLAGASAGTPVTLYAHQYGQPFQAVMTLPTGSGGTFSFVQTPAYNTVYQVRAGNKRSRLVFEAVHEIVTINATPQNVAAGQAVTFSGTVAPDKSGYKVELQQLGDDGRYHVVQVGTINPGSTYQIQHVIESPGQKTFRVQINGGPRNAGADSPSVTVTAGPPPPTS